MSHNLRSDGADGAGVVAELRRMTVLFQLRAVCTALSLPAQPRNGGDVCLLSHGCRNAAE